VKRIFAVALCVIALTSIASAFTLIENPVLLNGKPFANAVKINGNLFVSVQDFAKGAGAITLEPTFKLRGNRLLAVAAADTKSDRTGKGKEKWLPNALFGVRKAGEISSHVVMSNGKAFIPLADVARAFGATSWRGPVTLNQGESINLNFVVNGDGILGAQQ